MSALAAAITATGVAIGVPAPARAAGCDDYQVCSPSADTIVELGFTLFRIGRGGITPEDLEKLVLTAVGLMQKAEEDVIAHTDIVLVENTLSRLRTLLNEMLSYPHVRQNEFIVFNLYHEALSAMNDSYAVFRSVTDRRGKDDAARAVLVEYPIAVATLADYGRAIESDSTAGLENLEAAYIEALKDFRTRLTPECRTIPYPSDIHGEMVGSVVCVAATGREVSRPYYYTNGKWISGPVDVEMLKKEAAIGSAWLEAVQILEKLGQ